MLTVDAANGEITASGLANGADVSTVNGRQNLEFTKIGDAGVRCKTVNGQIVVTIPEGENNPPPPSIQYTTAFAELDTIELLNQRPAVVEPTGRKGALAEARA